MHKSCPHIQKSIYLAPNEVRSCCQRFFVDGKIKGDVSLLSVNQPRDIEYSEIVKAKKDLVEGINNGTDDRCSGCFLLKEAEWEDIEKEKLNVISIENHSLCNMKCTYCSDMFYGGVEPQYSLENLFKEVDIVEEDLHIAWGGGEPTIRKDFNDIFLNLNKKFHPKTQRVFTNALKHNKALQEHLDNRKTSITTSIDAGTEDTFRKVRNSKGMSKVFSSLQMYSENSPDLVTIKYIFTEDNFDSNNLIEFVKNIKTHNLINCNFLISVDFNKETLREEIILSIISLYFQLSSEGVNAISFDDHIFRRVREVGRNLSNHIDEIDKIGQQGKVLKDIIKRFKSGKNSVVIWGTGEFSKYIYDTSKKSDLAVTGFVDGIEEKWGTDFMGFNIKDPKSLKDGKSDIIIASVNFYGEIYNNIISMGISKDKIIPNFLL